MTEGELMMALRETTTMLEAAHQDLVDNGDWCGPECAFKRVIANNKRLLGDDPNGSLKASDAEGGSKD